MKTNRWNVLFTSSESGAKIKPFSISGTLIVLCLIFSLIGVAGFGRLVYYGASFGIARLGLYEIRRENQGLLSKLRFLEKIIEEEKNKIDGIVSYENNARLRYGLNSISEEVRKAGVGGMPTKEELMYSSLMDPVVVRSQEVKQNLVNLIHQAELQESTFVQMSESVIGLYDKWSHRPSIWPAFGRITSRFGYRTHPVTGQRIFHSGLDIANKTWTPVFTTADGIVKHSGNRNHFGTTVIISHYKGMYETLYAHLHKAAVTSGQVVERGDLIGYVGSTGLSTGPHLHYEVHQNGRAVNPLRYILASDVIVD
ncbi:M23 family metallopeptidase [Chitinispirillales bacterium ANBcel5]|uniref:M23 family metallopeptidase n=1 Tax=Cellulosispirillum alkaliphilum TaxID=3039283 RepID=UPI002A58B7AC|nr:M23 family metallopeptidase [Chitinispirillales bacterium ANBcel5]